MKSTIFASIFALAFASSAFAAGQHERTTHTSVTTVTTGKPATFQARDPQAAGWNGKAAPVTVIRADPAVRVVRSQPVIQVVTDTAHPSYHRSPVADAHRNHHSYRDPQRATQRARMEQRAAERAARRTDQRAAHRAAVRAEQPRQILIVTPSGR